ncbi:DivIVA domain-containing protein [Clostridium sp. SYSU_GA19001]|uniref:DivIVA domain-containing protein n=1 Tax=Clostridium caldaquaticum TaxID=2940653 RepID=UPI002076EDEF|nr:DivIVA domain-containing protein [Clostridium caldaquaticum]MCM8711016.1 DivIVA domain-containing protein [Clostridium caldaquaticum]
MKITAMDITNKEFKKVLRGYSPDEVEEFLDRIAEDYEAIYKENSSLKERFAVLNEKLDHYVKMETTIQNTLLLAQNAAEQSKINTQKEADLIIKNANESAQKILDKAHNDVIKINDDYERLKQEFIKFRAKFKNFMNTQVEMFNTLEKDLIKNYNIGSTVEDSLKEKEIDNEDVFDFKVKNINEEELYEEDLSEIKSFFVKGD